MEIIIYHGSKKDRLYRRYDNLNSHIKKELQGQSPVRGAVYDFEHWAKSKTKSNDLGTDKNGMRMKERDELKKDLKKKELL